MTAALDGNVYNIIKHEKKTPSIFESVKYIKITLPVYI